MLEMGLAKVYSCTEIEVYSFTCSKFVEGGLKFKNSAPGPWPLLFWRYFVIHEVGLAKDYWHVCEQLAQNRYIKVNSLESNPRLRYRGLWKCGSGNIGTVLQGVENALDRYRWSDALTIKAPRNTVTLGDHKCLLMPGHSMSNRKSRRKINIKRICKVCMLVTQL